MKFTQELTDKFSIGLSMLCLAHCLALPFIIILLPSWIALHLESELFHTWMLLAVIPTSIFALTMGCKKHKFKRVLFIGLTGLLILSMPLILGESMINELTEKLFTMIGAVIMASAHYFNFRLCRHHDNCNTHCDCNE